MTDYLWAFLIAFAVCVGLLFALLPFLKRKKVGQEILIYVTEHDAKKGTPTMGGIAFVIAIALSALMFTKGKSQLVNVTLAVMVAYGATGFLDDFLKVYKKRNLGLRAYQKILLQLSIAVIMAFFVKNNVIVGDSIFIPFSNGLTVSFGWLIIPFVIFIFLAVTNGVNLTDGLDGLASSVTLCYMLGMVALLLVEKERLVLLGDTILSTECEQLIFVCVASIGGLLAFLLFNCFPAKIFMGDTGSLALGGVV
ncbi:MAG: phospho-N-acetylmuramoyl-pentapeptide-transferase, partial [Clostridia bacterium]